MAQDIRDMFREDKPESKEKLNKGHEQRFKARLEEEMPLKHNKGNKYFYFSIAAVLVVALGIGLFLFNDPITNGNELELVETPAVEEEPENSLEQRQFQLSDVSPEFKQIENYYMASINLELAKLEINNDNKALIDAFMLELEELDKEYQRLNAELNEAGPNEQTIEAMVANLQLRLELLLKLKNKLNEIKNSKNKNYENLQA
ncbi:hypothetical protein FHG64_04745 [Antarcticibacterium flavum]|uniref:Anti-sigma factor n=1 Tax=Antarcticibacterium flavum TaxID=2058175 RepID=A0A5B7X0A9_9FLAO|nr:MULTISPECIES: hypothetical protein [Antarcticibacterium]MCM4160767.1 hypothetical protein [Antarcticibacterium sp. W02-3]QCY68759.1 hypothetical protein FHG64_04745 [Antarcticibacterium flavum]